MLEVVFSESEACGLMEAKFTDKANFFVLPFCLDVGDIKESIASSYRQNLVVQLSTQNLPKQKQTLIQSFEKDYKKAVKNFQQLKQLVQAGEEVRVWVSSAPYALCGLYHLCNELADDLERLTIVSLPTYMVDKSITYDLVSWGELSPEHCLACLNSAEIVAKEGIRYYQEKWQDLLMANTALRANVNGQLMSVNEDFYDFILWQFISHKPVKQAFAIGQMMGCYPIGVVDYWFAKRIEDYIAKGWIQIVEDSELKYARTICLA